MEIMEINPTALVVTAIGWIICMVILWRPFAEGLDFKTRIGITAISLPVIYLAVSFQLNR